MTDLQELFDRDPLRYNKNDIPEIVAALRKMRHTFNTTATPATAKPRAAKKVTDKHADVSVEIKL